MVECKRYFVRQEPAPAIKPRWWRGLYQVWDRYNGTIRESFARWGEADKFARCLNGELSPFLCREAVPQQSHGTVWAPAA